MKKTIIAILAILCAFLVERFSAEGQGITSVGIFGNRTIGQSLAPGRGSFGGGVQTNSLGSFLYVGRPADSNDFARPWRVIDPGVLAQTVSSPALPTVPTTVDVRGQDARGTSRAVVPQALSVGQSPALPPPLDWKIAAPATSRDILAAEMSDRLTRIARAKGMLDDGAITVSLAGDTAIVEGQVIGPNDRRLLVNLVALEPGVRRVENRLVLVGNDDSRSTPSANRP